MPIETAIEQEAIADSLLGPPTHVVGTNPQTGNASLMTLENAGLEAQELPEVDDEEAAPAYLDRQEWDATGRDDSAADEGDELPEELQELQYEVRDELARRLAQEQAGQKEVTQKEVTQNTSAAQATAN